MSRVRFLVALVFLLAPATYAAAVYNYAGPPFDTETGTPLYLADPRFTLGESIDLTVDLSTALGPDLIAQLVAPVSWSLDVGRDEFFSGESGVTLTNAIVSTDSDGNIDNWLFSIFVNPDLEFSTAGSPQPGFPAGDRAGLLGTEIAGGAFTNNIGIWTEQAAAPDAATRELIIPGLAALLFLARRRMRASSPW